MMMKKCDVTGLLAQLLHQVARPPDRPTDSRRPLLRPVKGAGCAQGLVGTYLRGCGLAAKVPTTPKAVHLAAAPGLAFKPVVQRALGDVELPGRLGLGVHLALEQLHVSHRRASPAPLADDGLHLPVQSRLGASTRDPAAPGSRSPGPSLGPDSPATGVSRGWNRSITASHNARSASVSDTHGDLWISRRDESTCKPGSVTRPKPRGRSSI